MEPVTAAAEGRYRELMAAHHYLGAPPKIGETLWYAARWRDRSYCQIWCMEGWSCDGPAVLVDLDAVVELDPLDHFAELPEAA